MKITYKNGSDFRPTQGEYSTTTLVELTAEGSLGKVPSNIVFLIDSSSSMSGQKWQTLKQAVVEILDSLGDDDRVGVVLFGSDSKEIFPLASLAQNREVMKDAIKKLENPQGVTHLEKGLKAAYGAFDKRSASDKVKRVNHVILLTDGFPTDNNGYRMDTTSKYEEIVKSHSEITLTGLGIGSADDYDAAFIAKLSELGRGSYYHANDLSKFKAGLEAEIQKLQSSVVGELTLQFKNVKSKIMRIAKVTPEIVIYDVPGNQKNFELKTGSMTKDLTSFIIQTVSNGTNNHGDEIELLSLVAKYDGKETDGITLKIKATEKELDLGQMDPDVYKAVQMLQVNLNSEQIRLSLASGDKDKATKIAENTTKIASQLGQDKLTRALTKIASDIKKGKSVSDDLATVSDESKKTKLLIK